MSVVLSQIVYGNLLQSSRKLMYMIRPRKSVYIASTAKDLAIPPKVGKVRREANYIQSPEEYRYLKNEREK